MMHLCVWLWIIVIQINGEVEKSQCNEVQDAEITEIDVLSFVESSIDKKMEIAKQFDEAFHSLGAVRLVNHGIPYESVMNMLDKTKRFFDESEEYKMKWKKTGSNCHGFVPVGGETVGDYKGSNGSGNWKPDPVESFHVCANWGNKLDMQKGYPFKPKLNELPLYLADIMPMYWEKTRQLAYNLHWIASMALGFDVKDNIFEQNMTANSLLDIRLSNYPSINTDNMEGKSGYRFNPHQDYTGFTMVTNDNVGGLQISVNDSENNIIWYNIPPKLGGIVVLGGEFFERWTNSYWISSYHAVKSLSDRRISIITFVCPDLNNIIDILPCAKCMEIERKFEPVVGYDHLQNRMTVTFKDHEID
eukprot:45922_1